MSIHAWLHRRGIARVLNSSRNGAYIQARGPRWIAARLAMYTLRHSTYIRPDWQTARIGKAEQPGRLHWRFYVTYRRL